MSGRSTSRRGRQQAPARYPRQVRVNENLREVLADALERIAGDDARLELATITAVQCDPDLRHATVLMASLGPEEAAALDEARVRLQAAISSQVRMKRTPLLRFQADPAVATGARIEDLIRELPRLPDADDDETWRANYRLDE
ncbi:MAG TPA: ribosome-binding factor A [Acidimicrobiales bacterium]|nr:ribosome-binding factor A [Acidimicrobiales bacterium]